MRRAVTLAGAALAAAAGPEQIHITLAGTPGSVAVDFVTSSGSAQVQYGLDPSSLTNTATANSQPVTMNKWSAVMNQAVMTALKPNTTVYYRVGSDAGGWSQVYDFVNQPARNGGAIYAVYADFGWKNDESLTALIADANAGGFDYVVHAGDHAYNLDTSNSAVGNSFMNSIQPYAARKPYLASPGNHEAYDTQGGGNFTQFVNRYRAIETYMGAASGSGSNLWYSVNIDQVHWVAFTAETWTMSNAQIAEQAAWLEKDLAAVDRTATPWVVAFAHKSFQMDQTTWGMFDFLVDHNVDLFFVGHWHQYTRFPSINSKNNKVEIDTGCLSADNSTYTDCKYPITVVVGAPGNQEVDPRTCKEEWQVNCSGNYGYGKLNVVNATHAYWNWFTVVPVAGGPDPNFSDSFWVVKTA